MILLEQKYDARGLPANYLPAAMEARQLGVSSAASEALTRIQGFVAPGRAEGVENGNAPIGIKGRPDRKIHGKAASYVAVIDIGLVPWIEYGTARFMKISHLDFEPSKPDGTQASTVTFSEWNEDETDVLTGPLTVRMRNWVRRFPNCVYGNGMTAEDFSHGIAMTDLACLPPEPDTPSDVAGLIGIELPARVLEDPSGGILQGVMLAAIARAIDDVQKLERPEDSKPALLEIVLAYGFTGGPHDSRNLIAQQLKALLANAADRNVFPRLHVPMGNHQQQMLFARLEGDDFVDWILFPGDRTPNAIEFAVPCEAQNAEAPPSLRLAAPDGSLVTLPLVDGEGCDIAIAAGAGTEVIGSIYANLSGDGASLLGRLCLAATRPRPHDVRAAPNGRWKLTLQNAASAELWMLRDDAVSFLAYDTERKQTRFDHPDYRTKVKGKYGSTELDDKSPIKRAGSGSYLAASLADFAPKPTDVELGEQIALCGAIDKARGRPASDHVEPVLVNGSESENENLSFYSGITTSANKGTVLVAVDDGDFAHHEVQVAANGRREFVVGTSVAAALSGNRDAKSRPARPIGQSPA